MLLFQRPRNIKFDPSHLNDKLFILGTTINDYSNTKES